MTLTGPILRQLGIKKNYNTSEPEERRIHTHTDKFERINK